MNGLYALAINPWIILGSLAAGSAIGLLAPAVAAPMGLVGEVYVDLLKMIVLPFMVSAVIFSLQRLLRHGGAGAILRRTCLVFAVAPLLVAAIGIAMAIATQQAGNPSASQSDAYGRLLGRDASASDTEVALDGAEPDRRPALASVLRDSLVPTNVFAALAQGETLKALIFALLFGLAVGSVDGGVADGFARGLEAVYHACQRLTRWLNYPLPLVLVCMSAGQLAKTGLGPLQSMLQFLAGFGLASLAVVALSVLVLWRRGGRSLAETLRALRAPFALALATRSSATCMPSLIETLSVGLRFQLERVELLVPLGVSLLRVGPVLYYTCAAMFIAHLYDRALTAPDLLLLGGASVLAGFASAGMTGLMTVSLTGMVCGYLGLPFEAAFVLFLAVDPLCDMLRTVVLVLGNAAAVGLICPKPVPESDFQSDSEAQSQAAAYVRAADASLARHPPVPAPPMPEHLPESIVA